MPNIIRQYECAWLDFDCWLGVGGIETITTAVGIPLAVVTMLGIAELVIRWRIRES